MESRHRGVDVPRLGSRVPPPAGGVRPVVGEQVVTCLPSRGRDATVPLIGLVEGLVLAAFRKTGVPLQRIRPALTVLGREIGLEHALASRGLYSDGAEVLYDFASREGNPLGDVTEDLVVVRSGQHVFAVMALAMKEQLPRQLSFLQATPFNVFKKISEVITCKNQ